MHRTIILVVALLPFLLKAQQLLPIKKNQKWGLIDLQGNLQLNPKYDAITPFDQYGYASIQRNNDIGLINELGKEVIAPKYDDISVIGKKYFAILKNNKWKLINLQKQVLLEDYEDVILWEDRGFAFARKEKWGFLSFDGKQLIKAEYDAIHPQNDFIVTQNGDEFGLHQVNGAQILKPIASELQALDEHVYLYQKDGFWGGVNDKGVKLFPPEYESYESIESTSIQLKQGAKAVLYSTKTGQLISGYFYEQFLPFSSQYLLVRQKQHFGLIDRNGALLLAPHYDEIQPFNENYFRVQKKGIWGIVNVKGKEVVPIYFDYIAPLNNATSLVKKGNQYGIIDQFAQFGVPTEYDKIILDDTQIKAYKGESLTVYQVTEEGKISKEQGSFNEHVTFKIGGGEKIKSDLSSDNAYQLAKFEWFYDPSKVRWGLRTSADGSLAIDPQFDQVEVKEQLGFTVVGLKKRSKLTFHQTTYNLDMVFGLVNNDIGKLVTSMDFIHIEFNDFEQGLPIARCVFANGKHGMINRIGQVIGEDASYIGAFKNGVAKIGFYGTLSGDTDAKGLQKLSDYLDQMRTPYYMIDYTANDQNFRDQAQLICENCAWGYVDTLGKMIIPAQYENVKAFSNNVALVKQQEKWGVVNQKNKLLIPFQYDEVGFLENTDDRIIKVHTQAYRFGLIDTFGHIAVEALYQDIGAFSEGRLPVQQNGRWGFVDKTGRQVIPCHFQQVSEFSDGLAAAKVDGQWGFIDRTGKTVLQFQYGKVGNYKDGLIWATLSEGIQYIDRSGKVVISGNFERAFDFQQGVARIMEDRKFGLIDMEGQYLVRSKFTNIGEFDKNGLAIVRYGSDKVRYGVIDRQGIVVTDNNYNEIKPYTEGRAAVKLKDKYGYIDLEGKLVIPAIYARVSAFAEGKAVVQENGACGYIDLWGKVVIDLEYSKCLEYSDGRAVVYKGYQKAGLLNTRGDHIIKPSLNRLLNFKNGRGLMRDNNYRFYFITENADVFDGYYQEAVNFEHGVAVVRSNDKWGIVNQKGIKVIPPKYDKIEPFKDGYSKIRIKGFYGLVNLAGETIAPTTFEAIEYIGKGIFRAEQGDRIGYFDMKGKWIWEMQE